MYKFQVKNYKRGELQFIGGLIIKKRENVREASKPSLEPKFNENLEGKLLTLNWSSSFAPHPVHILPS